MVEIITLRNGCSTSFKGSSNCSWYHKDDLFMTVLSETSRDRVTSAAGIPVNSNTSERDVVLREKSWGVCLGTNIISRRE